MSCFNNLAERFYCIGIWVLGREILVLGSLFDVSQHIHCLTSSQVLRPRARQQHSSAEEYAQALEHLQDRLAKYKKTSRVLFGSAIGIFVAVFFGINAVPEVTQALDKRKVRLDSDLAMLEKQIEGVKEEMANQQAFVRKAQLEEEQPAENAPSSE